MIIQFLGFFAAGLAVNLTPCVYPMLTVTASLFKPRQAQGQSYRQSFLKALSYFLGIVITYTSLGYFAASSGKIFGAALQNPWVLGSVALMMFVLALSMFGLFQIKVSDELLNRLSGLRKANYLGLFFSGLLVGVFAAPCIGPPVLTLLAAVAQNGDPRFGITAFFVFSLGLGLPYLLLGTFSGLANRLPKAGNWLIIVERIFGLILMGFAIFYLSLALNWHTPTKTKANIWQKYDEQAVNEAIAKHELVVIDYFAQWCIGCHELDRQVFSNKEVQERLKQVAAFRIDATNIDSAPISKLIDKYEVIGLPTIIFLDTNGNEVKQARFEGAGSVKEFMHSLDLQRSAQ